MKTNITINLCGQLYHIDEDAYQLLKSYEENMRRYFTSQEGGEEIIDDIEHRVAELLTEIQNNGTAAISIEHIQEIIRRIGNPEQIDADADETDSTANSMHDNASCPPPPPPHETAASYHIGNQVPRKLFRDIKNAMLGGVSSGLAHYFGMNDPVFIRIAWVILLFLPYCPSFIAYVILWIIIPPATTPEQRLQMYGKPVTPQNLNEEIIQDAKHNEKNHAAPSEEGSMHHTVNTLLNICAFAFKGIIIFFLSLFLLATFTALIALLIFTLGSPDYLAEGSPVVNSHAYGIISAFNGEIWKFWILVLCSTITLGMPLYILTRRIFYHDHPHTNKSTRIAGMLIWVFSLLTAIFMCISSAINIGLKLDEQEKKEHTRNGIYLHGRSWAILDEGNWQLKKHQNADPDIYHYCNNLFTKDQSIAYVNIRKSNKTEAMKCTLQRNVDAEAGYYQLEGIVNANGDGCFLFSQATDSTARFTPITASYNDHNKIEKMTYKKSQETHYFKNATDSIGWEEVRKRSDEEDWYFISSKPFYHSGGTLVYGITNDSEFTQHVWNGKRFGFYDIVLTKIPEEQHKK